MLRDGPAEGLALLGVAERVLHGGARDADAAGRDIDAAELQPAERMAQPLAFLQPDQPVGGYPVVLEDEFGGIDALVAELLQLAADGEAGALLGEEEAHARMARVRPGVRLDEQSEAGAVDAVGNPDFGAVHDIVDAVAPRRSPDRLQVGAAIRLGQRKAAPDLPGGESAAARSASAPPCRSGARRRT